MHSISSRGTAPGEPQDIIELSRDGSRRVILYGSRGLCTTSDELLGSQAFQVTLAGELRLRGASVSIARRLDAGRSGIDDEYSFCHC